MSVELGGITLFLATETFAPQSRRNSATVAGKRHANILIIKEILWRRKRDSNPRIAFTINGFQDRRLKPLGHSSTFYPI